MVLFFSYCSFLAHNDEGLFVSCVFVNNDFLLLSVTFPICVCLLVYEFALVDLASVEN